MEKKSGFVDSGLGFTSDEPYINFYLKLTANLVWKKLKMVMKNLKNHLFTNNLSIQSYFSKLYLGKIVYIKNYIIPA